MAPSPPTPRSGTTILWILIFTGIGLVLRLLLLGNTFQSSDNAAVAVRILQWPGYQWMWWENYGVMINFGVKVFTGLLSPLGVAITEFWWKAPIAVLGALQIPLTYFFLLRLRAGKTGALLGAAALAVLPLHVMQSRYLWGYEVLGVFFITPAIWTLLNFFERPTIKRGLLASLFCGLYLISHGYILPFAGCGLLLIALFANGRKPATPSDILRGCILLLTKLVWLFPVLLAPLFYFPILHSLAKKSAPGIYFFDYLPGFIGNTGILLALLFAGAIPASLLIPRLRSRHALLLLGCSACYLGPLFFATPPGITVVRGYMLLGTYFLLLHLALVVGTAMQQRRKLALGLGAVCVALTAWGTISSVFGRDEWPDPTMVTIERGDVPPDPGTKAAGYLIRKYVPASAPVLAIHRALEPPNMFYYLDRTEHAYYDLSLEQTIAKFHEMKDSVSVIVVEAEQLAAISADSSFSRRVTIFAENKPTLWIYAKPEVNLPRMETDVVALNRAFDKEFSWKVSLQ